jgi:Fe-S-cluster containining protein
MANMERRETPLSIRQFLPMLPAPRPIEAEWKCKRSGDCCTKPLEVIMTKEEAAVLVHEAPQQIVMHFRPIEGSEGRYVALKAQPCPLFVFNGCLVYNSRPYNCRRFGCMRPDPKTEPFEIDSQGLCTNLMDRFKTSRVVRRMAVHMQHKARRWADKHGWKADNEN